jgi:hypothetical protein
VKGLLVGVWECLEAGKFSCDNDAIAFCLGDLMFGTWWEGGGNAW